MSNPQALSKQASFALQHEINTKITLFDELRKKGKITGAWEDAVWTYKGAKFNFNRLEKTAYGKNKNYRSTGEPISGPVGAIFRCYFVDMMADESSIGLLTGRIMSAKILFRTLGDSILRWSRITSADLQSALTEITEQYPKPTTSYHRANDLKKLHRYLKGISSFKDNNAIFFLDNRATWSHGLNNPERAREQNRLENINSQGEKYPAGLEDAIGALRATLKSNPELERKPNSDTLLVNAHAFSLALGLRAGELARLPIHTYDFDKRSGTGIIRNWTEKGAEPLAMPIPMIWHDAIKEAYDNLVEQCDAARSRATEIETNGFKFILDIIESENILSSDTIKLLQDADISVDNLCPLDLICKNFDITKKSFASSASRYGKHVVLRPSTRAIKLSKLASKIIELLSTDDVSTIYRKLHLASDKKPAIKKLGSTAGLPLGSCQSSRWVYETLANINNKLWQLYQKEENLGEACTETRNNLSLWLTEKSLELKSRKANNAGALVNYKSWTAQLAQEYAAYLARHFKENCDADSVSSGKFSYRISSSSFEESLPLGKHLIVVWDEQFNSNTESYGILPRPLFLSDIYNWLSTKGGKASVFQRYEIRDKKGGIYCLSHHQIRHWLTTAMLRSGPSEMLTNLWMGRSAQQLRNYDHRTPKERAEYIRSKSMYSSEIPPPDWLGRKIVAMRNHNFTTHEIQDYINSKLSILHFSPWGYCSRDLTITPCSKGLMCLKGFGDDSGCANFHIDPTDLVAKRNIQQTLSNYQMTLYALEPRYEALKLEFLEELDDSQALDQHLLHIVRIINGCTAALRVFDATLTQESNRLVKVFEHNDHAEKTSLA